MHAVKHVDVATVSNLCKHTEPSPANKPRPCVIRGAGNEMDLVKKLSYNNHKSRACIETYSDTNNNKSTPEAEEDDDNNQSLPIGILWLAQQTGLTQFRVFVSKPKSRAPHPKSKIATRSQPATFTLDGTDHPDSILTTSMSRSMTLAETIHCSRHEWNSCYIVEDDIPPASPLHTLVPPVPPRSITNALCEGLRTAVVKQRQLFIALGECRTQVHRDSYDNVYVCVLGQRHWLLAPPNDEWAREENSVSASMAALGSGEGWMSFTLDAGDAIFVPKDWWHSVRSSSIGSSSSVDEEACSVAVNWYFDSPLAFPSPRVSNDDNYNHEVKDDVISSHTRCGQKRQRLD